MIIVIVNFMSVVEMIVLVIQIPAHVKLIVHVKLRDVGVIQFVGVM